MKFTGAILALSLLGTPALAHDRHYQNGGDPFRFVFGPLWGDSWGWEHQQFHHHADREGDGRGWHGTGSVGSNNAIVTGSTQTNYVGNHTGNITDGNISLGAGATLDQTVYIVETNGNTQTVGHFQQ